MVSTIAGVVEDFLPLFSMYLQHDIAVENILLRNAFLRTRLGYHRPSGDERLTAIIEHNNTLLMLTLYCDEQCR